MQIAELTGVFQIDRHTLPNLDRASVLDPRDADRYPSNWVPACPVCRHPVTPHLQGILNDQFECSSQEIILYRYADRQAIETTGCGWVGQINGLRTQVLERPAKKIIRGIY